MIDKTIETQKSPEINIQPGQNMQRPNIPYDQDAGEVRLPDGVISITDAPSFGGPTIPDPDYKAEKHVGRPEAAESDPMPVHGIQRTSRSHNGGVLKEDRVPAREIIDTFGDINPDTDGVRAQLQGWGKVGEVALTFAKQQLTPTRPNEGWRMHDENAPKSIEDKPRMEKDRVVKISKPQDSGNVPMGNYSPPPIKLASISINPDRLKL